MEQIRSEEGKKAFILQLYDNTRDAVEVAKRNYLEFRIATGIQREMAEIREKFESLYHQNKTQLFDVWSEFQLFETKVSIAAQNLKGKSDEFVSISSHSLPYRVEEMSVTEMDKIKLPDYSRFLFDSNTMSFGPISEKWERLKKKLEKEFMNYLDTMSLLNFSKGSGSLASSLNLNAEELGEEEESMSFEDAQNQNQNQYQYQDDDDDDNDNDDDNDIDAGSTASSHTPKSPDDIILVRNLSYSDSASDSLKPEVVKRQKRLSTYQGGRERESILHLLTSSATSAETKRSIRILADTNLS